jgi:iron complex outermembrane receptor protein
LPRQIINTVLNYQANDRWSLQGSVQWIPEKTPVDNMSTLYADPYAVVDLRTEVKISDYILFFGEITNIFDEKYASSTLIVDQARADQAAFLPGDGRGFFVGMKAKY